MLLREGTHRVGVSGVTLDARDSHLTIQNFPSEEAFVSGALPLPSDLKWAPYNTSNNMNIWKASLAGMLPDDLADFTGLRVDGGRGIRARHPNANPELDLFPVGTIPDADWTFLSPVCPPPLQ